MASRKKLRPVSSPVDPFVTPANPGPAQSDQSWQGLLSLSDSLLQADSAYRAAEEKRIQEAKDRVREARVEKAEKRREANQANTDASVASQVLSSPANTAIVKRVLDGTATPEERLKVSAELLDAGVISAFNPITIAAVERFNVGQRVTTGQYANWMSDPAWLASTDGMNSGQFRVAEQERTAEWISEHTVKDSDLPVLMTALRNARGDVDKAYTSRRTVRHEAEKTALIVEGTGMLIEAYTNPDDPASAAFVVNFRNVWKELIVQDKLKAQATLKGALQANFTNKIVSGQMKESEAHEILEDGQEFLTDEYTDELGIVIANAETRRAAADRDQGTKRTKTELAIRDHLTYLEHTAGLEKGSDRTLDEQKSLIRGQYGTVKEMLIKAGLDPEAAPRLIIAAMDAAEERFNKPVIANRDLLVSLKKDINSLAPRAQENVESAFTNYDISAEQYRRFTTDIQNLASDDNGPSFVGGIAKGITFPAGTVLSGAVFKAGIDAFNANAGKDSNVKRDAVERAMTLKVQELTGSESSTPGYHMGLRNSGIYAGLEESIIKFVNQNAQLKKYYAEGENRDPYRDFMHFIFGDNRMSATERKRFSQLTEENHATTVSNKVADIFNDPEFFVAYMGTTIENARTAAKLEKVGAAPGEAIAGLNHADNWVSKRKVGAHWHGLENEWGMNVRTTQQRVIDNVREFSDPDKPMDTIGGRLSIEHLIANPLLNLIPGVGTAINNKILPLGRSLAQFHKIRNNRGTPLEMLDFPAGNPAQAREYLQAHFLHFGMPLASFVKGKHLGVDVDVAEFAFDSAPFFSSREELDAELQSDGEKWVASDNLKKAFETFGLRQDDSNFAIFFEAQLKLTAKTDLEKKFMKAMHTPNFSSIQSKADKDVGQLTFINGSNDWWSGDSKPNVFRLKSLTDKTGGK